MKDNKNLLTSTFQGLCEAKSIPDQTDQFNGEPIKGLAGKAFICIDNQKQPTLLLKNYSKPKQPIPPPTRLENLQIRHHLNAEVLVSSGKKSKGFFSVLALDPEDDHMTELFFEVIGGFLKKLKLPDEPQRIEDEVKTLIDIFQSIKNASRTKTQGLWSELFLILKSSNVSKMVKYWHEQTNDKYDFSLNKNFLEVKSTLSFDRKHNFSLHQAHPNHDEIILVASMMLSEDSNGLTLLQLMGLIKQQIKDDKGLINKFNSICYATLGNGYKDALLKSYNQEMCEDTIKFYDLEDIQKIDKSYLYQAEISDIRWTSNLDMVPSIVRSRYRKKSELFNIVL